MFDKVCDLLSLSFFLPSADDINFEVAQSNNVKRLIPYQSFVIGSFSPLDPYLLRVSHTFAVHALENPYNAQDTGSSADAKDNGELIPLLLDLLFDI